MLRLATPELEHDDEAVTVAEAARRLGCAPSTVRALLAGGLLHGHRVGKTAKPGGVRVAVVSIRIYKARNAIEPSSDAPANDMPRAHRPTHRQAMARLRDRGVV
jgi:excisionase family DNA binding protein